MSGEPRIRAVTPADLDPLCRFLEASFVGSGIGASVWRRLFEYQWLEEAHDHGLLLVAGDEIVGFLGTVHARHPLRDGARFCNFSSWYVRPQYRGWGIALLVAASRDADTTYTSFTPSTLSQRAFAALQFTKLGGSRIFMPLFTHADTLTAPAPRIDCEPEVVRGLLDPAEQQVFDDHAPFGCLQLVIRSGTERAYLVIKRRVQRMPGRLLRSLPVRFPYSEVLYCSAPQLLAQHLERVKLAVLRRQRTGALVADSRLWSVPPRGIALPNHAVYQSATLDGRGIDKLYSELVLLPI
ncbi:GNAT family N-acetyltransferase [Dankookia sp. P2]|uniref:GNAT family N-acetyltransferase n=1 Tax=Dankookia sp. P2 TaxID=3423955 RepID=UPI003D669B64